MLVLDKARALDRMVWLADRRGHPVPPQFLRPAPLRWLAAPGGRPAPLRWLAAPGGRPAPLRWLAAPGGRRALAGEVVLGMASARAAPEPAAVREREPGAIVG